MEKLRKFGKEKLARLKKHLVHYHEFQEAEDLHRARVEIKKIKSLLLLAGFASKKFKSHRAFIPFRNIFRKAGAIREPDVLLDLLMKHHMEGMPIEAISGNISNRIASFREETPMFIKTIKKSGEKLLASFKKIRTKECKRYLNKLRKNIKSGLYLVPDMKKLHKARKWIKELLYLSEACKGLKKNERKYFEKIEAMLGELHDQQVLLTFLKNVNGTADPRFAKALMSECRQNSKAVLILANAYYDRKA